MSADVHLDADRIPGKRIAVVIAATILITAGGVLWPWLSMRHREAVLLNEHPGRLPPAEPTPPGPSTILATPIETDLEGRRRIERDRAALESYDWVDREQGVVRIPIGKAMELVVREHRQ